MAQSRNRALVLEIVADTKRVEKQLSGFQRTMGSVAGAVGGYFAASTLTNFIGESIDAASDLSESINAVEVATGNASDAILDLGRDSATALGLSQRALNEAAVAFAGFGEQIDAGNFGDEFETYIQRVTDFASVMNLDMSRALQVFSSALAGQSEPIRRFGIDMSAATVAAYAYSTGIAETGTELTEAQKVQARYGLLLDSTNSVAGDFARTSEGLANTQRILTAEWEDAQAVLGERLGPEMARLQGYLVDGVTLIPGWVDEWKVGLQQIAFLAGTFGDAVVQIGTFGLVDSNLGDNARTQRDIAAALRERNRALAAGLDPLMANVQGLYALEQTGSLNRETFTRLTRHWGESDEALYGMVQRLLILNPELKGATDEITPLEAILDELNRVIADKVNPSVNILTGGLATMASTGDAAEDAFLGIGSAASDAAGDIDDLNGGVSEVDLILQRIRDRKFDQYLYELRIRWGDVATNVGWAADELDRWNDIENEIFRRGPVDYGTPPFAPGDGPQRSQTINVNLGNGAVIGDPFSTTRIIQSNLVAARGAF